MTVQPIWNQISPDHLELFSRGISAITVDPYKNVLYYFFPFIGAFFLGYQRLQSNFSQEAMMPPASTALILREIKDLTRCAEIRCEVIPYTALSHQFSSCGSSSSATNPTIFIPDHHLFRRGNHSSFGQEKPNENLCEKLWLFSDDETRFFIARELGQIRQNSALLRIAIKIAVIGVFLTIYASSFRWLFSLFLIVGVVGLHVISERFFESRADLIGAEILGKKINNPVKVAIDALDKMRRQNLYQRETSMLAKRYITERGDNLLDLIHPPLTTRIANLRASRKLL